MTTQIEAFRAWVRYYRDGPPTGATRAHAIKAMHEIVAMAQNGPPDGPHDGSFSREAWTMARDIVNGFQALERIEAEIQEAMARFIAGDYPKPPMHLPPRTIGAGSAAGDAQADFGFIDDDLPF